MKYITVFIIIVLSQSTLAKEKSKLTLGEWLAQYNATYQQSVTTHANVDNLQEIPLALRESLQPDTLDTALGALGLTRLEGDRGIMIIQGKEARFHAIPLASESQRYPAAQFVTEVLPTERHPASKLLPILRPLVKAEGHLAASPDDKALIIVDTFANIQRIKAIIAKI